MFVSIRVESLHDVNVMIVNGLSWSGFGLVHGSMAPKKISDVSQSLENGVNADLHSSLQMWMAGLPDARLEFFGCVEVSNRALGKSIFRLCIVHAG